jgi:hypothetical protein
LICTWGLKILATDRDGEKIITKEVDRCVRELLLVNYDFLGEHKGKPAMSAHSLSVSPFAP